MVRRTGITQCAFGRLGTAIVVVIALSSSLVLAQISTATMSGVVRDGTGGVIPGVTVTIKHTESGLTSMPHQCHPSPKFFLKAVVTGLLSFRRFLQMSWRGF